MKALPYDIWLHIASYLSGDTIWNLRDLNAILHDIAMDNRYKIIHVSMGHLASKKYCRDFLRFRDQDVARRVRHISYYGFAGTVFPEETIARKMNLLRKIKDRLQNWNPRKNLIKTSASFTQLSSVALQFASTPSFQRCIPLFQTNLRVSSTHLNSLSFHCPIEDLAIVIPSDLFLPQLSSFDITSIDSTSLKSLSDITTSTIGPFLNRHRLTIKNLRVLVDAWIDISSLLCHLDRFTSLLHISLPASMASDVDSFARFLEMHSPTLNSIYFKAWESNLQFLENVFTNVTVPFPKLIKLAVPKSRLQEPSPFDQPVRMLPKFIRTCSPSLVELDIALGPRSKDELFNLLADPLGSQETYLPKLRYLRIVLRFLTPGILDLLSLSLPELHTLVISAIGLKCGEDPEDKEYNENEFVSEMERISRANRPWSLEDCILTFQDSGYIIIPFRGSTRGILSTTLLMPSLQSLGSNMISDDFLQSVTV